MKSKKRVSRSRSSVLFDFKIISHQDGTRKKITKENENFFIIIQYKKKKKNHCIPISSSSSTISPSSLF